MDPAAPPVEPSPEAPAKAPSWRRRHPVAARALLYGLAAVLLGGGALVAREIRAGAAQRGLLTRLDALDQTGLVRSHPAEVLRIVREEVLPQARGDDLVRRARLTEAAALDALERYDEGERVYAEVDLALPPAIPRGPVRVPWANLRVRAGRGRGALELLDAPGATDGWPADGADGWRAVRARAEALQPPR